MLLLYRCGLKIDIFSFFHINKLICQMLHKARPNQRRIYDKLN